MSNSVTFKRGTTYSATVTYTPAAGGPANLLTTTVTTDIIDAGGTVYPCTVTVADHPVLDDRRLRPGQRPV
jgi:hypothetical protein